MKKIIDVSHWQNTINWPAVKAAGIDGAIIKAGGSDAGACIEAEYYNTGLGEEVTTGSAGDSQPHNNMPPYYSMPFWVRTA